MMSHRHHCCNENCCCETTYGVYQQPMGGLGCGGFLPGLGMGCGGFGSGIWILIFIVIIFCFCGNNRKFGCL